MILFPIRFGTQNKDKLTDGNINYNGGADGKLLQQLFVIPNPPSYLERVTNKTKEIQMPKFVSINSWTPFLAVTGRISGSVDM